jgi:glycine/D-amino acid oxidase-like deaminating enzyme/nitrite reductase/ring-hydroxylating ferredoxin subunit
MRTARVEPGAKLQGNEEADVCVVGAGIAGLTTAYLLTRARRSVIVLEDGEIGSGETSRTTAHLVNALDDRYIELERLHGERGARLAAESHTRAIDRIESIVREEQIDCGFERLDGYLFLRPGDESGLLDRELEAAHTSGLELDFLPRAPLDFFNTGPCLRFPRQAQFHPMQYLAGLASAIRERGGRIYTGTRAQEMKGGAPARVATADGPAVTAKAIVVATNTPVNDWVTMHTKQAAYRSYVIAVRVPRGSVTKGLYWDTADPYHYIRLQSESEAHDLLIVGGEDHKTGQEDDTEGRFRCLAEWTRERFPMAGELAYEWSGQIMEPMDGLAFIGRNPGDESNVYIATGDSGNGMTHGTIAGMLLCDLIQGRENAWATLYDPARVTLRAAKEFARENVNVVAQYKDLVTPGEIGSPEELGIDEGAVIRRGLTKIAVCRDGQGVLHERSAFCPHLGCVVAWNRSEKTWDCPCHGSRFSARGDVVNGPAIAGLSPAG